MPIADPTFGLDLGLLATLAMYVVLSGGVTVHALLRKRDVRAAIGWIGIAWLSPLFGGLLYFVLGINRVSRRASRLYRRYTRWRPRADLGYGGPPALADQMAILAAVGDRLTRNPLVGGNSLTPLRCGDEAYPAMLAAIADARRSVLLATYIFEADAVGERFIAALAAAKARGVEVRVLLDGVGAGYLYSPAARGLAARGVPAVRFLHHWLPWRMPFLNLRSHKKILVADGRLGFVGGMNIGAGNVLADSPRDPVEDVHFRVEGPVVRQLTAAFGEDWHFATGEVLDDPLWWPDPETAGGALARGISSGPDEDRGHLEAVLATALGAARRRVRIVTPYFLPDYGLISLIRLASLRGVEVEIVLPERCDHRPLDWAMRAHLRFLDAPDVRIVFSPAPFDHSKLMTVDGAWCLVGSANWDMRSMRLNFEFSLECYDAAAVAEIDRLIDAKLARSRPMRIAALRTAPLPVRLRDAATRLLLPYL